MHIAIVILNFIASIASTGWAVVALTRPSSLSRSNDVERGEMFFARMYAARAVPFGLAVGLLPFWLGGIAVAWIVLAAAAVQAADVAIGLGMKQRGMMMGGAVGATIHVFCAIAMWRP